MLVLTRQKDESIMIGDDVQIFIVDVRGGKVRLGIECPKVIPVHRKEVYEAIKREKQNSPPPPPENYFLREGQSKPTQKGDTNENC